MNLLEFIKPLQNELRQLLNLVGVTSMEEYMQMKELKIETNEEKIAYILGQMAMIDSILHAMIMDEKTEELLELEEE
jgi:ABC-type ATPase with predicted acetyltransferase domain|tara:strand:- start:290 stop:520 length:231 start_codon:yes stop_codon:yes gene_type:complete